MKGSAFDSCSMVAGSRLQVAGYRLQVVWVWVMSDELSLATCRL